MKMKKHLKLNILPENPEKSDDASVVYGGRFPKWLHRPLPSGGDMGKTLAILQNLRLPTVCQEAKCPNLLECFSKKTATFLAMGDVCTRCCPFCDINYTLKPYSLDPDEPHRIALSVKELGLKHTVVTMVARDDLSDGGASHLVKIIQEIRKYNPHTTVEILSSDFAGNSTSWDRLLEEKPEIFNHNVETVRRLSPLIRHRATYERSLQLLRYLKTNGAGFLIKSGMMVGMGEKEEEVEETITDLYTAGCDIITIGQYLQPNPRKFHVKAFITPVQFEKYAAFGRALGVKQMYCGPFVRSSYNAGELLTTFTPKNHE